MTGRVVVFAPEAQDDVEQAFSWYRERHALVDEEGNRRRVLRRFPYSLYFEANDASITVLAAAHHRRRPGYWRES